MSYVGVFWFVPVNIGGWSALVADMAPIEEVPALGGVKRYARSHVEVWAELAGLGERGLRRRGYPRIISSADYRTYPRGRVDFEVGGRRSIIRRDPQIQRPEFIGCIMDNFEVLPGHDTVFAESEYASDAVIGPLKPWN